VNLKYSDLSKKGYDSIQIPKVSWRIMGAGTDSGEGKMVER
jgi:hypothetical protein